MKAIFKIAISALVIVSCNKAERMESKYEGTWNVDEITATYLTGGVIDSTKTASNVGKFSLAEGDNTFAPFTFSKTGSVTPFITNYFSSTSENYWRLDERNYHRLIFYTYAGPTAGDIVVVYTIKEKKKKSMILEFAAYYTTGNYYTEQIKLSR